MTTLYTAADLGTALTFLALAAWLIFLVVRRRDLAFPRLVWLFAAFLFGCGLAHLLGAAAFWPPAHRAAALVKFATLALSWATLVALVPATPRLLALPSRRDLEREIAERARQQAEAQELHARQLEQRNAELLRSNQELDDFAYVASHDLKEPLRGISHYATFLLEDYGERLDEGGRDKLRTLRRLARRLESLIDSLLSFSRVGRVDLAVQETPLDEVVDEVLDSLRINLEEQGVQVRVRRPLPVVRCDRVRIAEVFRNLISNALKYNDKPERWIEVGEAQPPPAGGGHTLYVRDNGIGIPEKHLESVFRIFKRLHPRDKYGGGTGAGLTIVKKILQRHGGRVWVDSRVGEGSTFYFTVPGQP
jgi:light-regulated signal transduction histidine kinase (bacteriophytochrome)